MNSEHQKWIFDVSRSDAIRSHDRNADFMLRANEWAVRNGEQALKAGLYINGGAAVVLLGFIGAMASQDIISPADAAKMAGVLTWFAGGVAAAAIASGLAYFTNSAVAGIAASRTHHWDYPYLRDGPETPYRERAFKWLGILTVLMAFAAFAAFAVGMWEARNALKLLAEAAGRSL